MIIYTKSGPKYIEKLNENDEILSSDNKFYKIKKIEKKFYKLAYLIYTKYSEYHIHKFNDLYCKFPINNNYEHKPYFDLLKKHLQYEYHDIYIKNNKLFIHDLFMYDTCDTRLFRKYKLKGDYINYYIDHMKHVKYNNYLYHIDTYGEDFICEHGIIDKHFFEEKI